MRITAKSIIVASVTVMCFVMLAATVPPPILRTILTTNAVAAGNAGEVLTRQGVTGIGWAAATVGGGDSVWTNNGTAIFPNAPTNAIYIGYPIDTGDVRDALLYSCFTNIDNGYPPVTFKFYGSPVPDNWATSMEIKGTDGTNDYTTLVSITSYLPVGPDIGFIPGNLSSSLAVFGSMNCPDLNGYDVGSPYGAGTAIAAFASSAAKKQTALFAQTYATTGKFTTNSIAELYLKNYNASNFVSGVNIGISATDLSKDMAPEQSLVTLESYETGLPFLIARTNNGTHVFEIDGTGVLKGNGAGLTNIPHSFGSLMMNATNMVVCAGAAGVYTNASGTGFTTIVTNGFYGALAGNSAALTNLVEGYYRVTVCASAIGQNNQATEWEVFTNNVACDLIGFKKTFDAAARLDDLSMTGIIYLPVNCRTDFRVQDGGTGGSISIHRASITIGTP